MRRHFQTIRHQFEDFENFLWYVIENNDCDNKMREHFRHAVGGYKFQGDYKAFQRELKKWVFNKEKQEE